MTYTLVVFDKENDLAAIMNDGFIRCEVSSALEPDKVFKYTGSLDPGMCRNRFISQKLL